LDAGLAKATGTFTLRLFKSHVPPLWEDPANVQGGKWVIKVSHAQDPLSIRVRAVWFELLRAAVMEQLPFPDSVVCPITPLPLCCAFV
jgi:hypothetical protein